MRDDAPIQTATASTARENGLNGASDETLRPGSSRCHGTMVQPAIAIAAKPAAAACSQTVHQSSRSRALDSRLHPTAAPANASAVIVTPGKSSPSGRVHLAVQPHSALSGDAAASPLTSALS